MTSDETNAEFANIVFGQGNADWADEAAATAPKPEPKPVKESGLSYVTDEVDKFGSARSVYVMTYEGVQLFQVHVDLGCTVAGPKHPKMTTFHPIRIVGNDGLTSIDTNGIAGVWNHDDGSGIHVDGQMVASYVIPRLMRYVVKLAKF
jgi:hypothetical protein